MTTSTPPTLRRIHRRTLTEQRTTLVPVAVVCVRCRQLAPVHLLTRDPRTGDWAHEGHCPWRPERR